MNDDKNKKMSTNYKDYKYVYTGYDDFIKEHHLDKKEIKEEKEKIIHDHRNVFDFNNPNQHTHDYSFDFNNPNEHQHDYSFDFSQNKEKPKSEYKDKYGNVYKEKPKVTTTYNTQYTNNKPVTTIKKTNNNDATKTIKLFIFFFFIFPFIITFIGAFIAMFSAMDDTSYESDYSNVTTTTEIDPINAFCDSIETRSFTKAYQYITDQELQANGGSTWSTIIYGNDTSTNRVCGTNKTSTQLGSYALENLEEQFNNKYQANETITDAYRYYITEYKNGYYNDAYYITVGKIDNEWYLIKIN